MNAMLEPSSGGDEADQQRRRLRFNRVAGVGIIVALIVALFAVYHKEEIATAVTPGDTLSAVFATPYKLRPYRDDVKLAGVVVGTFTGEDYDEATRTDVASMKIDHGVLDKLGTAPSAQVRPTLVLGGRYYIDLVPGGGRGRFTGGQIPLARTSTPIELDRILQTLDKPARLGIRASIDQTEATLRMGGQQALRQLLQDAPATLAPTGSVLTAFRGTQPDKDLTDVVSGFESTAEAFTRTNGEVARITESLNRTAKALGDSGPALAQDFSTLPQTLRVTRAGLRDLQPTLAKLTVTAPNFRPSAQALDPLFKRLDPVLANTNKLVEDLRPLLRDLRPTVEDIAPTVDKLTDVFDDLRGPALNRINGPILASVLSDFRGQAPYKGGGENGNPLFHEIGYLTSHLVHTFDNFDRNGAFARLTAGIPAFNNLGGTTPSGEQFAEKFGFQQPTGAQTPSPLELPMGPDPVIPPPTGRHQPAIPPARDLPPRDHPSAPHRHFGGS